MAKEKKLKQKFINELLETQEEKTIEICNWDEYFKIGKETMA